VVNFISKKELIHIHMLLFRVKEMFELAGIGNEYFSAYDDLDVLPTHIFRRREEHKRAVLLLCFGVMRAVGEEEVIEGIKSKLEADSFSPTLAHFN